MLGLEGRVPSACEPPMTGAETLLSGIWDGYGAAVDAPGSPCVDGLSIEFPVAGILSGGCAYWTLELGVCWLEGHAAEAKLGPSTGVRLIGGRPRVLPPWSGPPVFHAEETFFAPRRWLEGFSFEGVTAERGSFESSQKPARVVGVTADCGQRN